jgi:hypothetical protein
VFFYCFCHIPIYMGYSLVKQAFSRTQKEHG